MARKGLIQKSTKEVEMAISDGGRGPEIFDQPRVGNIPTWEGNREKLPEFNTLFLYKDRKYLVLKMKGRLKVVDIEKEKYSTDMNVRLFGAKSDVGIANVLVKSEIATVEEVANAIEDDKSDHIMAILIKFTDWIGKVGPKKAEKFLHSKGVTDSELHEMNIVLTKAILDPVILETLLDNFL